ncbi:MAG: hypothetical protein ACOY3P_25300 [Planctomycetota bacterium]
MSIEPGDQLRINLAPFIGSAVRSRTSIPCEVQQVTDSGLDVTPRPPYRQFVFSVGRRWVETASSRTRRGGTRAPR